MLQSTSVWNICGQCGRRPIRVYSGMISTTFSLFQSKTLTLDRNAQKESQQNRSQNRGQRRTRTSTQSAQQQQQHQLIHHHQHHLFLRRPPPSRSPKPNFKITTNRSFSLKPISSMEVEVKLRFKDASAHRNLTTLLSSCHVKTLHQSNYFFDTPVMALESDLAVLRLRFLGNDARCIISLKAKPTLTNGVSRVEEDEEDVDPQAARECVNHPNKLLDLGSRIVKRVKEQFEPRELMCLGGFENVRQVFEWKGLKLEVDETKYPFGTSYEVECETENPEEAKRLLEEFLNANGIGYSYSEMTKFAVFRSGKLPS